MVIDFDVDGDGKVTLDEVAMKERMLEVELREEKAESQTGIVAAYMGATAYMAGKPMGNKVAMKKDMR